MSQSTTLAALRERIRHIEQPVRHGVLPFGIDAIDAVLPGGGLALGAVHEIFGAAGDEEDAAIPAAFAAGITAHLPLSDPHLSPLPLSRTAGEGGSGQRPETGEGFPATSLPCPHPPIAARWAPPSPAMQERVNRGNGIVLWCQKQPDLYGPGLAACGLNPTRLILVTAPRDTDLLWAIEEVLSTGRAAGIAAVVGEIGRLPMVAGRRLQLAAERSGITALLLRRWRNAAEAEAERERPTAALTRWRVSALPSRNFTLSLPPAPAGESRGGGWTSSNLGGGWAEASLRKLVGRPRWRVELLRCRGGQSGNWEVEVGDAAGTLRLSAGLADRPAAPTQYQAAQQKASRHQTSGIQTAADHARRRAG